jgi:hypothetical protein
MQLKKLILLLLAGYGLGLKAQNNDSTLAPIEIDFISSYYLQDGNKSPVTGGIGDEELSDEMNIIKLYLPATKKVDFTFYGGVDHYTSASTDNINNEYDLYTETSASYSDKRFYGNLGVNYKFLKSKWTLGINGGYSKEWDVKSINGGGFVSKLSKNENQSFKLSFSYFNDTWDLIYPAELRWKTFGGDELLDENVRKTMDVAFTFNSVIDKRSNMGISIESTFLSGLLSTPFHRVYFKDNANHDIERLPNSRLKIPLAIMYNRYLTNFLITKLYYRYYWDDFGIKAQTFNIELPTKIFKFIKLYPFYRYHTQTASKYFQPFGMHSYLDEYYTSDFDLGNTTSHKIGLGLKYAPLYGVFRFKHFIKKEQSLMLKKITIRGAKYYRLRGEELILKAFIITCQFTFSIG